MRLFLIEDGSDLFTFCRRSRPTDGGEVVVVHARPPAAMMMPSRSTPNLQTPKKHPLSVYYRDAESPPPAPPVRDSSSLKSIKYGPGHEKFPSWPVPAAAEAPQALRGPPSGGSHRSKSWTEHTDYPKEKPATYTRPYMKRQHPSMQQVWISSFFFFNAYTSATSDAL